ncbi:hypothetical protein ACFLTD_02400, partial [Elusimicrobiota bacterium]
PIIFLTSSAFCEDIVSTVSFDEEGILDDFGELEPVLAMVLDEDSGVREEYTQILEKYIEEGKLNFSTAILKNRISILEFITYVKISGISMKYAKELAGQDTISRSLDLVMFNNLHKIEDLKKEKKDLKLKNALIRSFQEWLKFNIAEESKNKDKLKKGEISSQKALEVKNIIGANKAQIKKLLKQLVKVQKQIDKYKKLCVVDRANWATVKHSVSASLPSLVSTNPQIVSRLLEKGSLNGIISSVRNIDNLDVLDNMTNTGNFIESDGRVNPVYEDIFSDFIKDGLLDHEGISNNYSKAAALVGLLELMIYHPDDEDIRDRPRNIELARRIVSDPVFKKILLDTDMAENFLEFCVGSGDGKEFDWSDVLKADLTVKDEYNEVLDMFLFKPAGEDRKILDMNDLFSSTSRTMSFVALSQLADANMGAALNLIKADIFKEMLVNEEKARMLNDKWIYLHFYFDENLKVRRGKDALEPFIKDNKADLASIFKNNMSISAYDTLINLAFINSGFLDVVKTNGMYDKALKDRFYSERTEELVNLAGVYYEKDKITPKWKKLVGKIQDSFQMPEVKYKKTTSIYNQALVFIANTAGPEFAMEVDAAGVLKEVMTELFIEGNLEMDEDSDFYYIPLIIADSYNENPEFAKKFMKNKELMKDLLYDPVLLGAYSFFIYSDPASKLKPLDGNGRIKKEFRDIFIKLGYSDKSGNVKAKENNHNYVIELVLKGILINKDYFTRADNIKYIMEIRSNPVLYVRLLEMLPYIMEVVDKKGDMPDKYRDIFAEFMTAGELDMSKVVKTDADMSVFRILLNIARENPQYAKLIKSNNMISDVLLYDKADIRLPRLLKISEELGKNLDSQGRMFYAGFDGFRDQDDVVLLDKVLASDESVFIFSGLLKMISTGAGLRLLAELSKMDDFSAAINSASEDLEKARTFDRVISINVPRQFMNNTGILKAVPVLIENIPGKRLIMESLEVIHYDEQLVKDLFGTISRTERSPPERNAFQLTLYQLTETLKARSITQGQARKILDKMNKAKKADDYYDLIKNDLVKAVKKNLPKGFPFKKSGWKTILTAGTIDRYVPQDVSYILNHAQIVEKVGDIMRRLGESPDGDEDNMEAYLTAHSYAINARYYSPEVIEGFEKGYHLMHDFGAKIWNTTFVAYRGHTGGGVSALPSEIPHKLGGELDTFWEFVINHELQDRLGSVMNTRDLRNLTRNASEYVEQANLLAKAILEKWIAGDLDPKTDSAIERILLELMGIERYRQVERLKDEKSEQKEIMAVFNPGELHNIGKKTAEYGLKTSDELVDFRIGLIRKMEELTRDQIDNTAGIEPLSIHGIFGAADVYLKPYNAYWEDHQCAEKVSQDFFIQLILMMNKAGVDMAILPYMEARAWKWFLTTTRQMDPYDWKTPLVQINKINEKMVRSWADELIEEKIVIYREDVQRPESAKTFNSILAKAADAGTLSALNLTEILFNMAGGDLITPIVKILTKAVQPALSNDLQSLEDHVISIISSKHPHSQLLKALADSTKNSLAAILKDSIMTEEELVSEKYLFSVSALTELMEEVTGLKGKINKTLLSNQDLDIVMPENKDFWGLATIEEQPDGTLTLIIHKVLLEALEDSHVVLPGNIERRIDLLRLLIEHEWEEYKYLKKNPLKTSKDFHELMRINFPEQLAVFDFIENIVKPRYKSSGTGTIDYFKDFFRIAIVRPTAYIMNKFGGKIPSISSPGRLSMADKYLLDVQDYVDVKNGKRLIVDFGCSDDAITTRQLAEKLARENYYAKIVGFDEKEFINAGEYEKRHRNLELVRSDRQHSFDIPFENVDVIRCANVLLPGYYEREKHDEAIQYMGRSLREGGILIAGNTSEEGGYGMFRVYQRIRVNGSLKLVLKERVSYYDLPANTYYSYDQMTEEFQCEPGRGTVLSDAIKTFNSSSLDLSGGNRKKSFVKAMNGMFEDKYLVNYLEKEGFFIIRSADELRKRELLSEYEISERYHNGIIYQYESVLELSGRIEEVRSKFDTFGTMTDRGKKAMLAYYLKNPYDDFFNTLPITLTDVSSVKSSGKVPGPAFSTGMAQLVIRALKMAGGIGMYSALYRALKSSRKSIYEKYTALLEGAKGEEGQIASPGVIEERGFGAYAAYVREYNGLDLECRMSVRDPVMVFAGKSMYGLARLRVEKRKKTVIIHELIFDTLKDMRAPPKGFRSVEEFIETLVQHELDEDEAVVKGKSKPYLNWYKKYLKTNKIKANKKEPYGNSGTFHQYLEEMHPGSLQLKLFDFTADIEKFVKRKETGVIEGKLSKFIPVEINTDIITNLPLNEIKAIEKLIDAADLIERIYLKQNNTEEDLAQLKKIKKSDDMLDTLKSELAAVTGGLYDLEGKRFSGEGPLDKPAWMNYFPPGTTTEKLQSYIDTIEDENEQEAFEDALFDDYTLLREEDGAYSFYYYSGVYPEVERIATLIFEAADLTSNKTLRDYLYARSEDLKDNEFDLSNEKWMDLKQNLFNVLIGPVYQNADSLLGIKAAYGTIISVRDSREIRRIRSLTSDEVYNEIEENLEKLLGSSEKYNKEDSVSRNSVDVMNLLYGAGHSNTGYVSMETTLPAQEGYPERSLLYKNVIRAKADKILKPMAERVLSGKKTSSMVDEETYFDMKLVKRISGSLGPGFVPEDDDILSVIENLRSDIFGLYTLATYIKRVRNYASFNTDKAYTVHFVDLMRILGIDPESDVSKAAKVQLNYFMEKSALKYDTESGLYGIDTGVMKDVLTELAGELLVLINNEDEEGLINFIEKYSSEPVGLNRSLELLSDLPLDIRLRQEPVFNEIKKQVIYSDFEMVLQNGDSGLTDMEKEIAGIIKEHIEKTGGLPVTYQVEEIIEAVEALHDTLLEPEDRILIYHTWLRGMIELPEVFWDDKTNRTEGLATLMSISDIGAQEVGGEVLESLLINKNTISQLRELYGLDVLFEKYDIDQIISELTAYNNYTNILTPIFVNMQDEEGFIKDEYGVILQKIIMNIGKGDIDEDTWIWEIAQDPVMTKAFEIFAYTALDDIYSVNVLIDSGVFFDIWKDPVLTANFNLIAGSYIDLDGKAHIKTKEGYEKVLDIFRNKK